MKSSVCFVVFFLASVFLGSSESAVVFRFANVYGDHMVLQQEPHRARVWGYGEVGQKVFLTIDVDKYQCGIKQGKVISVRFSDKAK